MIKDIYRDLGITPVINCATYYTKLGGSIMAPQVRQAMADAADAFVDVVELYEAIGERIASITNNEAAYVTNGAAAGMVLAAAACMTGDDPTLMARLPHGASTLRNEFIVQRNQRNYYDAAIRHSGGRIVEIGHAMETSVLDLDLAFSEKTAGVFYFAGSHLNRRTLPLPVVIEWAHAHDLPVIVDAAAQIPPASNLWHFTKELGADLAIFSGGKGMGGPQNSGLVVGKAELVRSVALNGPPNHRIGRPLKIAREAAIGLMAAIELYLDPTSETRRMEQHRSWTLQLQRWHEAWTILGIEDIRMSIAPTGEAGEPIPRLIMQFGPNAPLSVPAFLESLRAAQPRIEVVTEDDSRVAFSAHLLREGDADVVQERVRHILANDWP